MARRTLNARELRTLDAAAECILPSGGPFPYGHRDIDYRAFVTQEYIAHVPGQVAQLIVLILWFLEYFAWIFARRPGRFSKLSLAARNAALDRLRCSRLFFLRGFFILLSTMLLVPFYRDPRVMDAIGYTGYKPEANKRKENL